VQHKNSVFLENYIHYYTYDLPHVIFLNIRIYLSLQIDKSEPLKH